jgi:hypothetical protein
MAKRKFDEAFGVSADTDVNTMTTKRDNFIDLCDDMLDVLYGMARAALHEHDRCHVMQLVNRHWRSGYRRYFKRRFGIEYAAFLVQYGNALAAGVAGAVVIPKQTCHAPWAVLGSIRLGDDTAVATVLGTAHRRTWRSSTLYQYAQGHLLSQGHGDMGRRVGRYNADVLAVVAVERGRRAILRQCMTLLGVSDATAIFAAIIHWGTTDQLEDHVERIAVYYRPWYRKPFILDEPGEIYQMLPETDRTLAMFAILVRRYMQTRGERSLIYAIFGFPRRRLPKPAFALVVEYLSDYSLFKLYATVDYTDAIEHELRQRYIPLPRPRPPRQPIYFNF